MTEERVLAIEFLAKENEKDIDGVGRKLNHLFLEHNKCQLDGATKLNEVRDMAKDAISTAEKANKNTNKILWIMVIQVIMIIGAAIFDAFK